MKRLFNILFFILFLNNILYSQTWQKLDNLNNNTIYTFANNNDYIFVGTTNGKIYISSNNGLNWYNSNSNLSNSYIYSIVNFNNKIYVGTDSGLYISSDKGKSWLNYDNLLANISITNIFSFKNILYAYNPWISKNLFFSIDAGINWSAIGPTNKNGDCFVSKGDSLFWGGYSGIFISLDSGKIWKEYKRPLDPEAYSKDMYISKNKFYFLSWGSGSGGIYLSIDYGNTWIYNELANVPFKIIDFKDIIIIATNEGGVFYSKDYGNTWSSINNGLPNLEIYSMALIGNTLYCGPDSSGIYKLDLGFLGVQDTPENNKQLSICPNPVQDILTISNLPNDFNYNTNIEIYNIYGLKVIEIPYTDKIDVSKLSAGVYYLKINNQTKKFVKI